MTHDNRHLALRASARPAPFPDWTRVRVTARLGLNVAESINFRRPGGKVYSTYGGPIHNSTLSEDRKPRRATLEAADAVLYRSNDDA